MSAERSDEQLALANSVDVMVKNLESDSHSAGIQDKYHNKEKNPSEDVMPDGKTAENCLGNSEPVDSISLLVAREEATQQGDAQVKHQQKVSILFELLSACVVDTSKRSSKASRKRQGYDARQRVALRLLATWLDVKWTQMVRIAWLLFQCACLSHILFSNKSFLFSSMCIFNFSKNNEGNFHLQVHISWHGDHHLSLHSCNILISPLSSSTFQNECSLL